MCYITQCDLTTNEMGLTSLLLLPCGVCLSSRVPWFQHVDRITWHRTLSSPGIFQWAAFVCVHVEVFISALVCSGVLNMRLLHFGAWKFNLDDW